jgi:hypothetical protein
MAKSKINKSAAIRAALAENPKARSKEIVTLLGGKGIKVAPSLVYYIKSRQKRLKKLQRRQLAAETSRSTGTADPVQLILRVKELARDAGGLHSLKQLVDVMAE